MKKIIHIDMDCFYAAVEMRDNPKLSNVPIAVGGKDKRRGVVSTCNYLARKFGVRSAMPTIKAFELCPNLVLVPGRMEVYKQVSRQIQAIFSRYTDLIEPLSLDEAYLDVSNSPKCQGSATLIAQAIRQDIFNELNLTASAGVAPIKFVAKVASDVNKPNGICVVTPDKIQSFVDELPLERIPGVGKVSLEKLNSAGLYTCLDVRERNQADVIRQFGRLGASLWNRSHGIDLREVETTRERKSVGVERTLASNIINYDQCWELIEDKLFPELERRLRRHNDQAEISKQGIKLKFADFQLTTIEHQHNHLDLDDFKPLLKEILSRQKGRGIRLIGLNVTLKPQGDSHQLSLI
ncbi:DNA polymerase IV [Vibrio sp. FNV 38]|nr:DNA polymerase IV [Vibrio sp. FNV 38]